MSTRASPSATTLRGRWLLLARAAWVIIATLALGLFLASIPGYVSNVLTLGQADWMGAPVEAPAGLVFVLDLLGVMASSAAALVCLTLAVVLFWRRSDDWMVMFISSYLLLYGTIQAGPLEWAEAFYPGWPSLAIDVVQPLFLTAPTIALYRSLSRRETRPPLDTLADPPLDPVERGDDLPATRLYVGSCGHDRARCRLCADLSLPPRFHTDRATTNQVGTIRFPIVVGADRDTRRALQYRDEPSSWQPTSLVDSCRLSWLVGSVDHRAALIEHRCPSLSPLRHRHHHQPYPRLRLAHADARASVLRERNCDSGPLPSAHEPGEATPTRRRGLHAGDRRAVHAVEASHPVVHRPQLLPKEVRR